jgi:hypothetical protein
MTSYLGSMYQSIMKTMTTTKWLSSTFDPTRSTYVAQLTDTITKLVASNKFLSSYWLVLLPTSTVLSISFIAILYRLFPQRIQNVLQQLFFSRKLRGIGFLITAMILAKDARSLQQLTTINQQQSIYPLTLSLTSSLTLAAGTESIFPYFKSTRIAPTLAMSFLTAQLQSSPTLFSLSLIATISTAYYSGVFEMPQRWTRIVGACVPPLAMIMNNNHTTLISTNSTTTTTTTPNHLLTSIPFITSTLIGACMITAPESILLQIETNIKSLFTYVKHKIKLKLNQTSHWLATNWKGTWLAGFVLVGVSTSITSTIYGTLPTLTMEDFTTAPFFKYKKVDDGEISTFFLTRSILSLTGGMLFILQYVGTMFLFSWFTQYLFPLAPLLEGFSTYLTYRDGEALNPFIFSRLAWFFLFQLNTMVDRRIEQLHYQTTAEHQQQQQPRSASIILSNIIKSLPMIGFSLADIYMWYSSNPLTFKHLFHASIGTLINAPQPIITFSSDWKVIAYGVCRLVPIGYDLQKVHQLTLGQITKYRYEIFPWLKKMVNVAFSTGLFASQVIQLWNSTPSSSSSLYSVIRPSLVIVWLLWKLQKRLRQSPRIQSFLQHRIIVPSRKLKLWIQNKAQQYPFPTALLGHVVFHGITWLTCTYPLIHFQNNIEFGTILATRVFMMGLMWVFSTKFYGNGHFNTYATRWQRFSLALPAIVHSSLDIGLLYYTQHQPLLVTPLFFITQLRTNPYQSMSSGYILLQQFWQPLLSVSASIFTIEIHTEILALPSTDGNINNNGGYRYPLETLHLCYERLAHGILTIIGICMCEGSINSLKQVKSLGETVENGPFLALSLSMIASSAEWGIRRIPLMNHGWKVCLQQAEHFQTYCMRKYDEMKQWKINHEIIFAGIQNLIVGTCMHYLTNHYRLMNDKNNTIAIFSSSMIWLLLNLSQNKAHHEMTSIFQGIILLIPTIFWSISTITTSISQEQNDLTKHLVTKLFQAIVSSTPLTQSSTPVSDINLLVEVLQASLPIVIVSFTVITNMISSLSVLYPVLGKMIFGLFSFIGNSTVLILSGIGILNHLKQQQQQSANGHILSYHLARNLTIGFISLQFILKTLQEARKMFPHFNEQVLKVQGIITRVLVLIQDQIVIPFINNCKLLYRSVLNRVIIPSINGTRHVINKIITISSNSVTWVKNRVVIPFFIRPVQFIVVDCLWKRMILKTWNFITSFTSRRMNQLHRLIIRIQDFTFHNVTGLFGVGFTLLGTALVLVDLSTTTNDGNKANLIKDLPLVFKIPIAISWITYGLGLIGMQWRIQLLVRVWYAFFYGGKILFEMGFPAVCFRAMYVFGKCGILAGDDDMLLITRIGFLGAAWVILGLGILFTSYVTKSVLGNNSRLSTWLENISIQMFRLVRFPITVSGQIVIGFIKIGKHIREASLMIWNQIILPIWQGIRSIIVGIWTNPYSAFIASLSILVGLWKVNDLGWDQRIYEEIFVKQYSRWVEMMIQIRDNNQYTQNMDWTSIASKPVMFMVNLGLSWFNALQRGSLLTTPSFAWFVFIVGISLSHSITHQQTTTTTTNRGYYDSRVPLRIFTGPIIIVSVCYGFAPHFVLRGFILSLVWGFATVMVTFIDDHQRRMTEAAFVDYMEQRGHHIRGGDGGGTHTINTNRPTVQTDLTPEQVDAVVKSLPIPSAVEKVYDDPECAICMEKFEEPAAEKDEITKKQVILLCGHEFHAICIGPWLTQQNRCPLCRAPVKRVANAVVSAF